jgi:hypothetical protein
MGTALVVVGVGLYLVGLVWMLYVAWQNDDALMAVGIFFLGPVFGTVYALQHWDEVKVPYLLMMVGLVLRIAGIFIAS